MRCRIFPERLLKIFSVQPPEASLHYPTFGQHDKLPHLVVLDHLHFRTGQRLYHSRKLFPTV